MDDGYQVDLPALQAAAYGIARTADQVGAHPAASLSTGAGSLGNDRWRRG